MLPFPRHLWCPLWARIFLQETGSHRDGFFFGQVVLFQGLPDLANHGFVVWAHLLTDPHNQVHPVLGIHLPELHPWLSFSAFSKAAFSKTSMLLACRPSEHRLGILLCSLPPWLFQVIAHGCMQPAPWPLMGHQLGGRGSWPFQAPGSREGWFFQTTASRRRWLSQTSGSRGGWLFQTPGSRRRWFFQTSFAFLGCWRLEHLRDTIRHSHITVPCHQLPVGCMCFSKHFLLACRCLSRHFLLLALHFDLFKLSVNVWYCSLVSLPATTVKVLVSLWSFLQWVSMQFNRLTFKLHHTCPLWSPMFSEGTSANRDSIACLSGCGWIKPLGSKATRSDHSGCKSSNALGFGLGLELKCS